MSNITPEQLSLIAADEFEAELEMITPEKAAWMLRFNTRNRKLSQVTIDEIARLMLGDDFKRNGEAIKLSRGVVPMVDQHGEPILDAEGKQALAPLLMDGQHRLEAIVLAGKTNPDIEVELLVIRGLEPDTQSTMDTGRKRTTGNAFQISGEKEANNLAAFLAGVWKWDSGDRKFGTHPKPVTLELEHLLNDPIEGPKLRNALDKGLQTGRAFPALSKSSLAIAHYILSRLDPDMMYVPYFFRLIATGANLKDGHPVLALRERAQRYRTGTAKHRMTMSRQVGLIFNAWNNCVRNIEVGSLIQGENDPVNEPMSPVGRLVPMLTSAELADE